MQLIRDDEGVAHIVPVSGGHDSTCLALQLREREPRPYTYVMTPTGNELPELFTFMRWLGDELGSRIIPVMEGRGLLEWSRHKKAIPNFRMRHCTPGLKIMPLTRWLSDHAEEGPIMLYVGLRADEEAREGALYPSLPNVSQRFPLREWGMGDPEVLAWLEQRNILQLMAERTDCALCYHQQIGEWWRLWHDHPELFAQGVAFEEEMGSTFRTPKMKAGEPVIVTRYGHTYMVRPPMSVISTRCAPDAHPLSSVESGANGKRACPISAPEALKRDGPATSRQPGQGMRELKSAAPKGKPMEQLLTIKMPFGRKCQIPVDTYQAIKRAIPIYASDARVAAYAAAPHEGLTPEIVAAIRSKMIVRGELPKRVHSRRRYMQEWEMSAHQGERV